MDFFALTNVMGVVKAGNPQNMRPRASSRPADSSRQETSAAQYDGVDVSSVFADKVREAYERRKNSHL